MKPTKVIFKNKVNIEPKTTYKRCMFTLFLLKCSYPKYELLEDMIVDIHFEDVVYEITIKKGYQCDLASIPRMFWSVYPPDGAYRYSAILHDMLYQSEMFTRYINDNIFKLGMHESVPDSVRNLFYNGVRVGGSFVYKGHTEETIANAIKYLEIKEIKC